MGTKYLAWCFHQQLKKALPLNNVLHRRLNSCHNKFALNQSHDSVSKQLYEVRERYYIISIYG